jgi:NAD(P)-dependent dehydrogenase (short-subunit alcohol dehydrogenase family)
VTTNLTGSVALITASTTAIGYATGLLSAQPSAHVLVGARPQLSVQSFRQEEKIA